MGKKLLFLIAVSTAILLCLTRLLRLQTVHPADAQHNPQLTTDYQYDLSEVELSSRELEAIRTHGTNRTAEKSGAEPEEQILRAYERGQQSQDFTVEIEKPELGDSQWNSGAINNTSTNKTYYDVYSMKFRRPSETWRMNTIWQVVNATAEIYLYTAHYDDRPALDQPAVRVIAVTEADLTGVFCVLWYPHNDDGMVIRADVIPIGPRIAPNFTKWYEEVLLSCNISTTGVAPSSVSIVTTENPYLSNSVSIHIAEKPAEQIEFGHCMSVVYWKLDPYRVVEWLELHKMWGIGEVNIYTNSVDSVSKAVLQHYVDEGFVKLREAPSVFNDGSEATILLNMSPVINDCFYRNMYRYKRVVCTDFDEMIVPRIDGNYSAMIKAIDTETQQNHSAPSYMFRNVYFFMDFQPVSNEPWYTLSARFLRHLAPSGYGYSVKSITDTRSCIALQNHLCWKRAGKHDTPSWNTDVGVNVAMNYHYKKCHFDEYLGEIGECEKMMNESFVDNTMLRFEDELTKRMRAKLQKLNLLIAS